MKKDTTLIVPSRLALTAAEEANTINGHENLGFLSEEYGFLPKTPPLLSLPRSHQVWDELTNEFPKLYKSGSIRKTLDSIPELDASEQNLSNKYVYRAATLLGLFAHAYYWLEAKPKTIPTSIMQPWQQISLRLNKPKAFFTINEYTLYNWQFRDLNNTSRQLNNLDLLLSTIGESAENFFLLSTVEMTALSAPIIGAIVRAQEAIAGNNRENLKDELELIAAAIERLTYALPQINLNPYSNTYVDPVVWGKCIGLIAAPCESDVKGASGAALPYFHLMDSFLGRGSFNSGYGKDELYYRQYHNTPNVRNFINAVEEISLINFVKKTGDPVLKGIFYQLVETYAGEAGLLGAHRRKAYGYMSTAFKVGRTVTAAGGVPSVSSFISRDWDKVGRGLEQARQEREKSKEEVLPNFIVPIKSISVCNKPNSKRARAIPSTIGKNGYRILPISEIALHNNSENGFWIIINDEIYDLSEFIYMHPGGDTIITNYAGMDATKEYEMVKHHLDSSINAMLDIYKIGAVKKLNLGDDWGIFIFNKKIDYISIEQLYNHWLSYLQLVIEMENIQAREIDFYQNHVFNNEEEPANLKIQSIAKWMNNFLHQYVEALIGEKFQILWQATIGLCAQQKTFDAENEIDLLKKTLEYNAVVSQIELLVNMNNSALRENLLANCFNAVDKANKELLFEIKTTILRGIKLFEKWENETLKKGPLKLVELLEKISFIFPLYLSKIMDCLALF